MPLSRSRNRRPESHLCHSLPPLTLLLLCSSTPLQAQDTKATAAAWAADSSRAVAAACKVVQSLREKPGGYRCYVEAFKETATEYIVRVREVPRDGTLPSVRSRSTVQIRKTEPSVTVTQVPDL
jgi:hypothetical protein